MLDTVKSRVNGLDLNALGEAIQDDPCKAKVGFSVATRWTGQTRSETSVDSFTLAGNRIHRTHKIVADEPNELLGSDGAPNPQELLMAAVNACMTVGYVAGAATKGITLDKLEIRTSGTLDLRGFLGLDDQVPAGYETLNYEVLIDGNGTPEQFEEIHQTVMKTSPNYFNLNRPIRMNGVLRVG
jgi:uncharacterized OsmC-like protein